MSDPIPLPPLKPQPRRMKKRHMAAAGGGVSIVGILLTWSSIAPLVCPVLPTRIAAAVCAPALLKAAADVADGGVP